MNCPRCEEQVEDGASFCGNCGLDLRQSADGVPSGDATRLQPSLSPAPITPGLQPAIPDIPEYALVNPADGGSERRATTALVLAILSLPAAAISLLGGVLAVVGLVLGTTARKHPRRTLANLAIGFACTGLILSIGSLAYVVQHSDDVSASRSAVRRLTTSDGVSGSDTSNQLSMDSSAVVSGSHLDTHCFAADLPQVANIENTDGSCTVRAFSARTLVESHNVFTVDAAKQPAVSATNFPAVAKRLVDTYVQSSLPGFTVTTQHNGSFAESPAYYVNAKNTSGTTMQMAIVLHVTGGGENIFVLVHALDDGQADVRQLESSWEWR